MIRIQAPLLVVATHDARLALGARLRDAGLAAYREIALAAKGLEIAHLQFVFQGLTLAVCSRVRRDGMVEIEIGMGDPRLQKSVFTAAQLREAEAASRSRLAAPRRSPRGVEDPGRVPPALLLNSGPGRQPLASRFFRLASVRSRSALSLMKPDASLWS
ncbi:hypothetical protein DFR50_109197 [Roseiarcus fermentans]|uniref:Uncharacterized protein n=1 Tax=Roseiarcus fermentans TaxID=1473586 RepID=A0A366FIC9_9HYPH|nr:hypothetical protein [Roseiarcus fermentans]RBP14443.1 hypothetical protein DFR50_109197 [Roseiarcus fermentans]